MTNSRALRECPCQRRSYRSRIRPALAAKSGSRGNIQLRCRQGRSASALSQRHKVAPLISATNPWVSTSRRISERESRESGSCKRCGSSQASALTWTTTRGGEKRAGRPPRGCDSRPGSRARANRLRHLLTIWRGVSRRAAIMSLERPSAANNTIFARTTPQYGDVY
jgi:hypothetical protein